MSDIVLGIDLGTTNSVVSIADGTDVRVLTDEGGSRLIPSVVSFHPDGRVLVGVDARERRLVDAPNTVYSIKRLIGRPFRSPEVTEAASRFAFKFKESANGGVLVGARNETYTLTEISAFVLREVRRIAELAVGKTVTKAVITVPAAFNELQRSATKAAGRVAGLEVLRIVNEPTAAALAYGIGKNRKERVAVYDLGGGTFDLTLLELEADVFEVLGSAGDSFLGGDDVDTLLADAMADEFLRVHRWDARQDRQAYERVRAAAEWLKCELSTKDRATVTIEDLAFGSKGTAIRLEFTLDRARFDAMITPLVERSIDVCRKVLGEAKLSPADLDAVILVGGSTRVPLVRTRVREYFALDPKSTLDPDLVVSQGAAIHAYALSGKKTDKSIGRVALKRMTVQEVMAVQQQRQATRAAGPKQQAFATNDLPPSPAPRVARPEPAAGGRVGGKVPLAKAPPKAPVVTAAAVPVLPPPKPRVSTMPPAPARAIEAPPTPPMPPVAPQLGPKSAQKPAFFPEPQHVRDIAALDTAVRRASMRPEAMPAPSGHSALLTLDDLDDPLSTPAVPSAPRPAGGLPAPAGVLPTMPEPVLRPTFEALPPIVQPIVPQVVQPVATPPAVQPPRGVPPQPAPAIRPPPPSSKATVVAAAPPPPHPPPLTQDEGFPDDEPEIATDDALPTLDAHVPAPLPMTQVAAPLLLDVTPLSLGVETVGGYCQTIIRRNVPIPCEQTRTFTTASDRQTTVVVRICQGESRMMAENQLLGTVELSGLRPAARGQVRIAVTFVIDASGILDVKAIDEATGEAQTTRVQLLGGSSDADIDAMRARQQRLVGG